LLDVTTVSAFSEQLSDIKTGNSFASSQGDPYISSISVDLGTQEATLYWSDSRDPNVFSISSGAGRKNLNCNDVNTSWQKGSCCTPKGDFIVVRKARQLGSCPACKYATYFGGNGTGQELRGVAFHYHWQVTGRPASHGCIRLRMNHAKLIYNNSVVGTTRVNIFGEWTPSDIRY
jgi:lipoprotein-anchoring transpeptidase ErfK/SrfK